MFDMLVVFLGFTPFLWDFMLLAFFFYLVNIIVPLLHVIIIVLVYFVFVLCRSVHTKMPVYFLYTSYFLCTIRI